MKPSTPPAPGAAAPRGLRSGMILAFALVILLLMSLMGVVILTSSQTELKITGNTRLGREAFNSADSCARIATFLTLVLVKPKNETIDDVIKDPPASGGPRYPLIIERSARFTYEKLLEEATNFDYTKRYKETGVGDNEPDPHLTFKIPDGKDSSGSPKYRTVATAVVNIETHNIINDGASLGTGEHYESGDGPSIQLGIIVSVTGRTNTGPNSPDEPASVITIMYRNFMS